jgi:hypothetical protein
MQVDRSRKSTLYQWYMCSPLWRLRRFLWWSLSDRRCELCRCELLLHHRWGDPRRVVTVHHRTYARLGHERRADVQLLCWPCHRKAQFHARRRRALGVAELVVTAALAIALGAIALGANASPALASTSCSAPASTPVQANGTADGCWGFGMLGYSADSQVIYGYFPENTLPDGSPDPAFYQAATALPVYTTADGSTYAPYGSVPLSGYDNGGNLTQAAIDAAPTYTGGGGSLSRASSFSLSALVDELVAQLGAHLPIALAVVGAVAAIAIAVRFTRKAVKA